MTSGGFEARGSPMSDSNGQCTSGTERKQRSPLRDDPLVNSAIKAAETRGDAESADKIRALRDDLEVLR